MEAKDREKSCCSQEEGPKTTAHPVEDIAAKRPRLDLEAQEVTSSSLDTKPSAIASEATTISSQAIPKRSGKPRRTADPKLRAAEAREKEIQAFKETMPNNIVFRIKNGIRYCSPYWGTYKTETKGRWVGRKLTEVFQSEFLSFNPNYVVAAARRGRIIINGKQMNNIDHVMKLGEKIQHIAHRHEHPVLDVPIQILAETEDMMVVNKPASMPVHACGNYKIHTVLGLLWKLHGIVGLRVLHRLDRTTSGVLLFAKNQEADRFYTEMIKSRNVNKEYVCRVDGQFPTSSIVCDQPIGTLVVSMGIQCIRPDGKSAKSTFRRIWYDQTTNQSVVLVKIETGRTHQIRVHLQFLGYPIVDDLLYNCFVWGPEKGKNAEYGKDYEQLGIDVRERHKATLWQEEIDPDYDERILKAAQDPDVINLEPWDTQTLDEGPDYDPLCMSCNVVKKTPTLAHFRMPLHCWRYETEKFTYKAPLPDWAWPPTEGVVADLDPEGLYDDAEKMRNSGQLEVVEKRTGAVGVLGGGNGGVGVPDGTISQDVVLESKSGAVSVSDSTISQDVVLESKNEETRVPDRTIGQEKVPEHLNEPVLESAGTRLQEGDIKVPEEKSDQIGALEALTTQEMTVDDSTKSKLSGTLGTEAGI